jgi:hypothetical protein
VVAKELFAAIAAALLLSSPLAAQKKAERKIPLGMEGSLRVFNMVGSVVVHAWSKDTVLVRGTLATGDRMLSGGSYTGAKIFVESSDDGNPQPAKLEIWLPARAKLWVKTATADIDIIGAQGSLDLYVVSGTIDVNGNPRELNAEAIDGDIHITGSPNWVRGKTASGVISFRGASPDASFSTVSGAIKVDGGVFERAKLETVTGNIAFSGRVDRSGSFDFDTHSGNIDIAIPDKTDASFSVVTITGTITNNVSKKVPVAGRFGRGAELTMDAGDGGARVSVRTFKGPVTLRRAQ